MDRLLLGGVPAVENLDVIISKLNHNPNPYSKPNPSSNPIITTLQPQSQSPTNWKLEFNCE